MLPLQFFLPKPPTGFPDPLAPLGISFQNKQDLTEVQAHDFQTEIEWFKQNLHTHPLVGAVTSSGPPPPVAEARRSRQLSQGGERAEEIAAQFADPSEIAEEEYPESVAAEYPDVM